MTSEARGVSEAIHSSAQFPIATPGHRHGLAAHAQASGAFGLAQPCGQHHRQVGVVEATRPTRRSQGQTQGQTSTAGDTSNPTEGEFARRLARRLARHQREGLAEHPQAQAHDSRRIPDDQGEVVLGTVAHHSEPTPARPFNHHFSEGGCQNHLSHTGGIRPSWEKIRSLSCAFSEGGRPTWDQARYASCRTQRSARNHAQPPMTLAKMNNTGPYGPYIVHSGLKIGATRTIQNISHVLDLTICSLSFRSNCRRAQEEISLAYVQPYVKVMSYDGLRADAVFPYPGRPRTQGVSL